MIRCESETVERLFPLYNFIFTIHKEIRDWAATTNYTENNDEVYVVNEIHGFE